LKGIELRGECVAGCDRLRLGSSFESGKRRLCRKCCRI
jgi:hypothetical protein